MRAWPSSLVGRTASAATAGIICAFAGSIRSPDAWSQALSIDASSDPPTDDDGVDTSAPAADAPIAPIDPKERSRWLTTELDRLCSADGLPRQLVGARIGVSVIDVATGTPLWAHEGDAAMNLASNAKLLTATAALQVLGTGFRWQTAALIAPGTFTVEDGAIRGDIYLWGTGDPTLTELDLRQMAHELALAGVRSVRGSVVVDASWFDANVDPPHYNEQPEERAGFRAPIAAVTVERSTIAVVIEPDPRGATAARVRVEPSAPEYVRMVTAEVATIANGRPRVRVDVSEKKGWSKSR